MGTNSLSSESDGNTADAGDVNQYKDALVQDLVPRNTSGVVTDEAGSLGSATYKWLGAFLKKITVGVPGNLVTIEESSGALQFKIAGTIIAFIDSTGISLGNIKFGSITSKTGFADGILPSLKLGGFYSSNNTLSVPDNVKGFIARGCGGGGGGGGGGGSTNVAGGAGGGGGSASPIIEHFVPSSVAGTITISIGAGGTGGTGGGSNTNGNGGNPGSNSSILYGTQDYQFLGGGGGGGGKAPAGGGDGGAGATNNNNGRFGGAVIGAAGGVAGSPGFSGQGTAIANGGSQGSGNSGGGGGGGAAGFRTISAGGNGGSGGLAGGNGGGGSGPALGGGGGGGGGAGTGFFSGGNGASGGNGWIEIWWVF